MTGPHSTEKPLIDLGTPQAERLRSMNGKSPRNMIDAFSSMQIKKKSRMSLMSNDNDSTANLIQSDDLTDELLQQQDDKVDELPYLSILSSCCMNNQHNTLARLKFALLYLGQTSLLTCRLQDEN